MWRRKPKVDKTKPVPIPASGHKWVISKSMYEGWEFMLGLWPEGTDVDTTLNQMRVAKGQKYKYRDLWALAEQPFNNPKHIRRLSQQILKDIHWRAEMKVREGKMLGEIASE